MQMPIVLKIGGTDLDEEGYVEALAQTLAQGQTPVIIVHGGGKEISQMQRLMKIQTNYLDGLRVTDEKTLQIAEMILCGTVNTRLVRTLVLAGVEAQGLNGMDRGLIRARKLHNPKGDLGYVGEPIEVRGDLLLDLLESGVTPVIAPICLGEDSALNVNADHVAGAVAKAVNAEKVIFATHVPGVLNNGELIRYLTPDVAAQLMADEVIHSGMVPKVYTAFELIDAGVPQVLITNLEGLLQGEGTTILMRI